MSTRVYQEKVVIQSVAINAHDCPSCGVIYGIAEDYEKRRREDGATWYCPNGHTVTYNGTRQQLEKKLAQAEDRLKAEQGWAAVLSGKLETERKGHAATKGQLTKTRNRVAKGLCMVCRRHFMNVQRHMETQHTDAEITGASA